MSDVNEDRTVAFHEPTTAEGDKGKAGQAGIIEVPKARLICTDSSQVDGVLPGEGVIHLMPGSEQTVGRGETCTYPIPSRKLSRQHARIFAGVGAWGVEDLNSTNGIQVNRQKVKTAWLKHGDEVRLGAIPFRFELERPDLARPSPAMAFAAPSSGGDDGEGDRTMMVGSLGASKAVIEATRKVEEAPQEVIPPRHSAAATAAAGPATGGLGRGLAIGLAVIVVVGVAVAAYLYLPTWRKQQQIADLTSRTGAVIQRVIDRSRELSTAEPQDASYQEDLQRLGPVVLETWRLLEVNPVNLDLINVYARARFLEFERGFRVLFARENFTEAERLANEVKARLDELERRLPTTIAATEKTDLVTASGLTDLAGLLISYRRFGREYRQVAKSTADRPVRTPTAAALDQIELRRDDFVRLRKTFNKALSSDYLPFNRLVKDVEANDLSLIGRWRELLRTTTP